MATFKSLSDMQKYLEENVHTVLNTYTKIEDVLVDAMVESVWMHVYDAYEPSQYNRREDDGGLADPRNMEITSVTLENGRVKLIFENIAQGDDTLRNEFLTDTIEEGIKKNWYNSSGAWAEPRPFIAEMVQSLKNNPTELIEAVKSGLIEKGFKVK